MDTSWRRIRMLGEFLDWEARASDPNEREGRVIATGSFDELKAKWQKMQDTKDTQGKE
jgi:hypothetical protein